MGYKLGESVSFSMGKQEMGLRLKGEQEIQTNLVGGLDLTWLCILSYILYLYVSFLSWANRNGQLGNEAVLRALPTESKQHHMHI